MCYKSFRKKQTWIQIQMKGIDRKVMVTVSMYVMFISTKDY